MYLQKVSQKIIAKMTKIGEKRKISVISTDPDVSEEIGPSKQQIRSALHEEFKLGRTAAAATRNIAKKFGCVSFNERTTQRWFKKFSCGVTEIKDQPGRGRKSTLDNDLLQELIDKNPYKSVRELAEELNVSHTTVARHLKEMGRVKREIDVILMCDSNTA